jgi:hypothetical protein
LTGDVDSAISINGNGPFEFSVDEVGTFTSGGTVSKYVSE